MKKDFELLFIFMTKCAYIYTYIGLDKFTQWLQQILTPRPGNKYVATPLLTLAQDRASSHSKSKSKVRSREASRANQNLALELIH